MIIHRTRRVLAGAVLAVTGLLVVPAAPAPAHDAASAASAARTDVAERKQPPRPEAFQYRATFTAEVTHHVRLEYYYEGDGRFIDASASLSGRLPGVTLTRAGSRVRIAIDTLRSTVKARSGTVDSTTISDHGGTEVRCQGNSIWRTRDQHPFVVTAPNGAASFRAFGTLSLPQTCRDNQGSEPTESVHSLPELAAPLRMRASKLGDKHITIPFTAERSFPRLPGQDKDCPDSAESLTKECTYRVQGTIELARTRIHRPVLDRTPAGPARTYVYDATFRADVDHHVQLQYYDERDGKILEASASVSGRIPRMKVSNIGATGYLVMDPSRSSVKAGTASVESTTTTDEGSTVVRCTGNSMWRLNKQHPYLTENSELHPLFHPFAVLSLRQTCRDNQGGAAVTSVHSLPVLAARLTRASGEVGDRRLVYRFRGEQRFPRPAGADECLGEVGSLTVGCEYTVAGRLVLTRVKRLG